MINTVWGSVKASPFYFNGKEVRLTKEYILSRISQYEIFKTYCTNFKELNKAFCSDLRQDINPSVCIYENKSGNLIYHDLATDRYLNCFSYLQQKYNISYFDILKLLNSDLRLNSRIVPERQESGYKAIKRTLKPVFRAYNITDFNFWGKYSIRLETLSKFKVYPCTQVSFISDNNSYTWYELKDNPIYAYEEFKDGEISYKLYRPYDIRKWYSPNKSIIQGFRQLPEKGELLVITKSLKDVMVLYEMGISAIAPQSETILIKDSVIKDLKQRFKTIVTLFDYDNSGIHLAWRYRKIYNIKPYFLTDKLWNRKKGYKGQKDISDFVKVFGLEQGKKLINDKIFFS